MLWVTGECEYWSFHFLTLPTTTQRLVPPCTGHLHPRTDSLVYPNVPSFLLWAVMWKWIGSPVISLLPTVQRERRAWDIKRLLKIYDICQQSWLGKEGMTQLCLSDPNTDVLSHITCHISTMDFEAGPCLSQIQGTNLIYISYTQNIKYSLKGSIA